MHDMLGMPPHCMLHAKTAHAPWRDCRDTFLSYRLGVAVLKHLCQRAMVCSSDSEPREIVQAFINTGHVQAGGNGVLCSISPAAGGENGSEAREGGTGKGPLLGPCGTLLAPSCPLWFGPSHRTSPLPDQRHRTGTSA